MRICRRCRCRSEAFHTNLFEGVPRDDTSRALQPPRSLSHSLPCAETHSAVVGSLACGEASGVAAMARRTERMERRKSARSSSFLQRSMVLRLRGLGETTACTARCGAASPRWESSARRCDRAVCLPSCRWSLRGREDREEYCCCGARGASSSTGGSRTSTGNSTCEWHAARDCGCGWSHRSLFASATILGSQERGLHLRRNDQEYW